MILFILTKKTFHSFFVILSKTLWMRFKTYVDSLKPEHQWVVCHLHLDEFRNDLRAVLGALRHGGTVDVLLLQEEGDEPSDEGHARSEVLVPGAEGAFVVPRDWHVQGFWSVVWEVWVRSRKGQETSWNIKSHGGTSLNRSYKNHSAFHLWKPYMMK